MQGGRRACACALQLLNVVPDARRLLRMTASPAACGAETEGSQRAPQGLGRPGAALQDGWGAQGLEHPPQAPRGLPAPRTDPAPLSRPPRCATLRFEETPPPVGGAIVTFQTHPPTHPHPPGAAIGAQGLGRVPGPQTPRGPHPQRQNSWRRCGGGGEGGGRGGPHPAPGLGLGVGCSPMVGGPQSRGLAAALLLAPRLREFPGSLSCGGGGWDKGTLAKPPPSLSPSRRVGAARMQDAPGRCPSAHREDTAAPGSAGVSRSLLSWFPPLSPRRCRCV